MCFLYTPSSPNLGLNIPKNMHVAKMHDVAKKTTCRSVADVKIDIKYERISLTKSTAPLTANLRLRYGSAYGSAYGSPLKHK